MGRATLNPAMVAALVCREYGWTYDEFEMQPSWFIDVILAMLHEEAEATNRKNKV